MTEKNKAKKNRNENHSGIFSSLTELKTKLKNKPKLQNLTSCGITHSLDIEKICGLKRSPNSLSRCKNNKLN